jgi:glutamate synthase domain-containing protein 2
MRQTKRISIKSIFSLEVILQSRQKVSHWIALGANTANSPRAMMMVLGCIQAHSCNSDHCPTGIATQDPAYSKGTVVSDKATRVVNFQRATIENLVELAETY